MSVYVNGRWLSKLEPSKLGFGPFIGLHGMTN